MQLIKDYAQVENAWSVVKTEDFDHKNLQEGKIIIPAPQWLSHKDIINKQASDLGVWFDSSDNAENIDYNVNQFPIIAVNFPKFTDGRGYSIARTLRDRYQYKGELRAIGDVLIDQLFFMKRCGFNSFALREDKDIEKGIAALKSFSESYQAACDEPNPLFRRRA